MAITVRNKPTSPNVTDTKLVYAVSSSNALLPQFQYVTDINLGGTRLTRLLTYPNPEGIGVLEVSSILGDNLEYDQDWKVSTAEESDEGFKEFTLHFSESYGTSISSSVTFYPGGASDSIEVFQGTVDPNQGSYNFQPSSSFQLLTNSTKGYISKGNYVTVPIYMPPSSVIGGTQDIEVEYVNAAGTIIFQANNALSPGSDYEIFTTPIASGSSLFNNTYNNEDWETIRIRNANNNDLLFTYNRVRPCYDDGVTFAFINNYGYFEYYSIGNPVRENSTLTREMADLPQVDYSNLGAYDITRRGEKVYNTTYQDTYDVTTDYLDEETANLVTELYDSPEVYVQEDGKFIPIVITDTTYTRNTNQNRQKLFQYTITYRYANARYSR